MVWFSTGAAKLSRKERKRREEKGGEGEGMSSLCGCYVRYCYYFFSWYVRRKYMIYIFSVRKLYSDFLVCIFIYIEMRQCLGCKVRPIFTNI